MDESSRFLIISLDGAKFAVSITRLIEITVPRNIEKDDRLTSAFEGRFEFRGKRVPVINLKKILKIPGSSGSVLLAMRGARDAIGLLVDAVIEIIETTQKHEPIPAGVMDPSQRVYAGVLRNKGELILLLNEDGLLQ